MIGTILRHPGVLMALGLLGMSVLVLSLVGLMMSRAGVSLRPITWMGGLMLLVVAPQLVVHTWDAVRSARVDAPREAALSSDDAPLEQLFGPDVDPGLILDARGTMPDVLGDAEAARFAVFPSGESVMLARFRSPRAAERAWVAYLAATGLRDNVEGDSQRGFAGTRPAGDRAYVLPMRSMIGVWTGANDATIRARMAAGGFAPPRNAPLEGESPALAGAEPAGSGLPLRANLAIVFVTLIIVVPYFFKGASWAGGQPRADVTPVDTDELRRRLLAINDLDVPFTIAVDSSHNVEATWRWADAKWVDHARAHGVRRTHRVLLRLDPSGHIARVTDYAASFDWSAGAGGGNVAWKASSGINFFEVRKERVFGVPLSGETSWRFNLQELKAPLIQAVTEAGWDWRPVLWGSAPEWLRWLTE